MLSVTIVNLSELAAQVFFLAADDRPIDRREQNQAGQGQNPTASGHSEPRAHQGASEIKRIARVGVRATHGELLVLGKMARGIGAERHARPRPPRRRR